MEPRISLITLGVADLERSRAFYRDVIGWQPAESPPEIVFFDLGGLVLALFGRADLAADMDMESAGAASPGFALAHNLRSRQEVDDLFARLETRGAKIVKKPEAAHWGGYSGYFCDPDGHMWEVAHNPFWTVLPDGRISMIPPADS